MGQGWRSFGDPRWCPVVPSGAQWSSSTCVVWAPSAVPFIQSRATLWGRDQWEEVEVRGGEAGGVLRLLSVRLLSPSHPSSPLGACWARGVAAVRAGQKPHRSVRFYFIVGPSTFRGCLFRMNEVDCYSALWALSGVANPGQDNWGCCGDRGLGASSQPAMTTCQDQMSRTRGKRWHSRTLSIPKYIYNHFFPPRESFHKYAYE